MPQKRFEAQPQPAPETAATPRSLAPPSSDSKIADARKLAAGAAVLFFAVQNLEPVKAIAGLAKIYPDTVAYNGKSVGREAVLEDKTHFFRRWPERAYRVDPETLDVPCELEPAICCTACGIVAWTARSTERRQMSTGSSRFALTFADSGDRVALAVWSLGTLLILAAAAVYVLVRISMSID